MAHTQYKVPHRHFRFTVVDVMKLYLFIGVWVLALISLPNGLYHPQARQAALLIGMIGIWRYAWWMINLARSIYYCRVAYPKRRLSADAIWKSGWRPNHVHLLITTYKEVEVTTHQHLNSLLREVQRLNISATLWAGVGDPHDIRVINDWCKTRDYDKFEVNVIRQNQPGKRAAIGCILRALSRHGVHKDDICVLMDGDVVLDKDALRKSLSLFAVDPELTALTTDEDAIVIGPKWQQLWLNMRFAQRRLWMQSHALSNKVLTLTGRMSAFRAKALVNHEMIRNIEADYLDHWLWGRFRFLSGDDKSTWYTLLKNGARMTYVPDAMVYTIEYVSGNGVARMRDNLLRWSGNMLRNGERAIRLGPRKVGPFIWWCLIDQRISIWTVLAGWTASMTIAATVTPSFLITYFLWVFLTRFIMSCTLYCFSDRIYISFPFLLYINQLASAFIKVYMLFRLPKQSWTNRAQKGNDNVFADPVRRATANYVSFFYFAVMMSVVLLMTGIWQWPYAYQLF